MDFFNKLLLIVRFNVRLAVVLQIVVLLDHPSLLGYSVCFLYDLIVHAIDKRLEVPA